MPIKMKLKSRARAMLVGGAAAAVSLATSFAVGETDVYGNEIIYSGEQISYQFWKSGAKAEDATTSGTHTFSLDAGPLDARARTVLSAQGDIQITRPAGFILVIR